MNILLTTHFICAHNVDFCITLRYIFVCASFVSQQLQLSGLVLGELTLPFHDFFVSDFYKIYNFLTKNQGKGVTAISLLLFMPTGGNYYIVYYCGF